MKNLTFKFLFILFLSLCLFIYVFPWYNYGINILPNQKEYRFGLDLQGGIELDYQVDLEEFRNGDDFSQEKEKEIIESLKRIIDTRIEKLNINDSQINDSNYLGERHIIVQIPLKSNNSLQNSENIQKAKEAIGKVISIVFKEKIENFSEKDYESREKIANSALEQLKNGKDFSFIGNSFVLKYENIDFGDSSNLEGILKDFDSLNLEKGILNSVETLDGDSGFLILSGKNYLYISSKPSLWKDAIDSKGKVLNDKYFLNSSVVFSDISTPMIELVFNPEGAEIFAEITDRLIGKQLAIFVGGELLTAPVVNETIYAGKAVITGNYTIAEAKTLSEDINIGVVPAPIFLTSQNTIDSKIGKNSLEKLIISGIIGFILIFIFLIIFYRVYGFFAGISLFIYLLMLLSFVKIFSIVLTLASIAGLVLSLGIAIDANILIFERIKQEIKSGKDSLEAINIGFSKSFSAIWDSNFTGFIVALILIIFGINLIKGFGIMLSIGIFFSFFSSIFISRVFIFYLMSKINLTKYFF